MKRIYNTCLLIATMALALTGCKNEDPFITAGPNDTPRFLAPSSIEGSVETSENINRDEEFDMEVIVTPADYTHVYWKCDGGLLTEGTSIHQKFLAGDYRIQIQAVTDQQKQASRYVNLYVSPLDGDPVVTKNDKNLWLQTGKKKTLEGANLASVKMVGLTHVPTPEEEAQGLNTASEEGETALLELSCITAEDGAISFDVPEGIILGNYRASLVNEQGEEFGAGIVTVSDQEYQEPGKEKRILWSGKQTINWGDSNITITADELADVPVGTEISIAYNVPEAEYHAMRITTPQWGDNPEDNLVNQFDITTDTPQPFIFTYTEACKKLVEERGGMLIVGFGYEVTEVYYEAAVATQEVVLWSGNQLINWGDTNITITADELADVPVGTIIRLFYDVPEAEYHAMRITTPWWGDNAEDDLVNQFDITADTPQPFEFVYTETCKSLVEERGGMLIVGFGYNVTKVSYEVAAAPETTLWEGDTAINWGESNINITAEALAEVKIGSEVSIYYTVPDADYHAMRITTPQWGDNPEDDLVNQFDITADTPQPFTFTYTEACKRLADLRGGMLIVGFGYNVQKVTIK